MSTLFAPSYISQSNALYHTYNDIGDKDLTNHLGKCEFLSPEFSPRRSEYWIHTLGFINGGFSEHEKALCHIMVQPQIFEYASSTWEFPVWLKLGRSDNEFFNNFNPENVDQGHL